MPKDALTIYRAAEELFVLKGGRVDKVNMPSADTILLLFHTAKGNFRVILSCNPALPRAHITALNYKNPETATGTLMYFRKRLTGAVLTDVTRDECERMIELHFSALDELRERVNYTLYVELTGKCADIVFVEQNGIIGNALRRISAEADGKRAVFPGLPYRPPNPTGRVGVFDSDFEKRIVNSGLPLKTAVNKTVAGLSPATVDEIFALARLSGDEDICEGAKKFADKAKELYTLPLSPVVAFDGDGKPIDFYTQKYVTIGGEVKPFPTLNAAMDEYYSALFCASDFNAYIKPLKTAVKNGIAKNKKRLAEALQKIAESETADEDRILGDLITANIYKIKRGNSEVTVQNYYDENGGLITIKLDVTKNAQQNAAAHYKAYSKKKRALIFAIEARDKALSELDILDGISAELDLCTEKSELDEVRSELVALGYIKPENSKKKKKDLPSSPYAFDIDGAVLLVGKNHAQNDRITKTAAKTDTWLHVKDAHGCHAVLKTPSPTQAQIIKAAQKAAYYSKARYSENVAVDYTLIKHVHPHGGGCVEYFEYKTVYVTPQK